VIVVLEFTVPKHDSILKVKLLPQSGRPQKAPLKGGDYMRLFPPGN